MLGTHALHTLRISGQILRDPMAIVYMYLPIGLDQTKVLQTYLPTIPLFHQLMLLPRPGQNYAVEEALHTPDCDGK